MECEVCKSPNATRVIDPYQADVNNIEVWMWLCDKDLQERSDDI